MIAELQSGAFGRKSRRPAPTKVPEGWEIGPTGALNGICPYFTMFPLSFPVRVLEREKRKQVTVIDPFCGRGTTLYAARLREFHAMGVDSNPTAVAISEAKLANTSPGAILRAYDEIMEDDIRSRAPSGEFWKLAFNEETLRDLSHLRASLLRDCGSAARRALRGILLGALHGSRTKGTPSYISNQMPRTFAPKPDYAVGYWRRRELLPPEADIRKIVERRAYRFFGSRSAWAKGRVVLGDSREATSSEKAACEAKADWVITSPPYYGMRTYLTDQWLRWWLVGGPSRPDYGAEGQVSHQSPEDFADDLKKVWQNMGKVCRDGAHLVIRFGSINDRAADPLDIIKASLQGTSWRVTTIQPAGTAADGKRQADHFVTAESAPPEYDIWARLD